MYDSYEGQENNLDAMDNHFINNAEFECLDFEWKIREHKVLCIYSVVYIYISIDIYSII